VHAQKQDQEKPCHAQQRFLPDRRSKETTHMIEFSNARQKYRFFPYFPRPHAILIYEKWKMAHGT
jgi:hypothetical protein